jgi:quinol monooxygenase YgiN
MMTKGLIARIDAKLGRGDDVARLLQQARDVVMEEPGTTAWFAVQFGRDEFGIVDAFPDQAAREEHLAGGVVRALGKNAALMDEEPVIEKVEILADKLDAGKVSKAFLLRLPIAPEHKQEAEAFLREGKTVVDQEPATTDWFALAFENGDLGVFDVFPDARGRRAHLAGEIPKQLAKHGLSWLGGLPHTSFGDVLAQKP